MEDNRNNDNIGHTDIILRARQGRTLLRVTGDGLVRGIYIEGSGNTPSSITGSGNMGSGRNLNRNIFLGYTLSYVILHENDEVTVYIRRLAGLWKLFAVYAMIALIAVSVRDGRLAAVAEGICGRAVSVIAGQKNMPWEDSGISGVRDSAGEEERAADGTARWEAERLVISSRRQGITFVSADGKGVRFGYVIYADGELLESAPYAFYGGATYTLKLYGRLGAGEHGLRVDTYCYQGEDMEQFDVISSEVTVVVEE